MVLKFYQEFLLFHFYLFRIVININISCIIVSICTNIAPIFRLSNSPAKNIINIMHTVDIGIVSSILFLNVIVSVVANVINIENIIQ